MKELEKEVYNFIEKELRDYKDNLKKLEELELEIVEASGTSDGQPRGNQMSNPTEAKTIKLMTTKRLLKLHENVDAIKNVYDRLNQEYKEFFDANYTKPILYDKQSQIQKVCEATSISDREYYRRRDKIVYAVATKMGYI